MIVCFFLKNLIVNKRNVLILMLKDVLQIFEKVTSIVISARWFSIDEKKLLSFFCRLTARCVKKLIFNLKQKRKTPTDACNQISICCVSQGISKVLKQGQSREYIFIVSHCPWSHIKLNKVIPNIYQNVIFGWNNERREELFWTVLRDFGLSTDRIRYWVILKWL